MEYEEYMVSLTEQIHNKRAKQLIAQEIENHITEQADVYEAEGMSHDTALREAVRQMGNPVETGIALNQIHKPKMPWTMLGIVTVLMLSSISSLCSFNQGSASSTVIPSTPLAPLLAFTRL